jgi:hypothetical protein
MPRNSDSADESAISAVSGRADHIATVSLADLREPNAPRRPPRNRPGGPVLLPHDLPVPDDVIEAQRQSEVDIDDPLSPPSSPDAVAEAPRIGIFGRPIVAASFPAVDDNGFLPPDAGGAVGPDHLVAAHNGTLRIQEKTGATLQTVSLDDFWAAAGSLGGTFDPKVLYDIEYDRWVIVACDNKSAAASGVLLGVSIGGNPTGAWSLYKATLGAFSAFVDHPSIALSSYSIVIQVNIIDNTNTFFGSRVYEFFKADVFAGGPGVFNVYALAASAGASQVPAMGSTSGNVYLVQRWNGNSNGRGWLRIWTIDQVLTPGPFVSTPNTWDSTAPAGANLGAQLGSSQRVQLEDDRIRNNVYCLPGIGRDYLYGAHTIFLPAGGSATRSAVQIWGLRTDGTQIGSTVEQVARFDDPTGATCYAYPSIGVSPVTHTIIAGFSSFSAARYPSAEWAFRWGSDPPNTLQAGGILKAGEGPYQRTSADGRNRWGDYSSTVLDPQGNGSIWTLQEYSRPPEGSGDGSGRWGTWWSQIELFEIG